MRQRVLRNLSLVPALHSSSPVLEHGLALVVRTPTIPESPRQIILCLCLSRFLVVSIGLGSNRCHLQASTPPITVHFKSRGDSSEHRQISNRHKQTRCSFFFFFFFFTLLVIQGYYYYPRLDIKNPSPKSTYASAPIRHDKWGISKEWNISILIPLIIY